MNNEIYEIEERIPGDTGSKKERRQEQNGKNMLHS